MVDVLGDALADQPESERGMITTYHGDNLEILPTLPPQSVQAVVTSPPYYRLRDYQLPPSLWPAISFVPAAGLPALAVCSWRGCLGLESDPWMYVAHLAHVFRLLRPILRDDGVALLNLGDSYAAGGRGGDSGKSSLNGSQSSQSANKAAGSCKSPAGLKEKDLLGIPWMVAKALQADGWYLRADLIWAKGREVDDDYDDGDPGPGNAMPESVRDRPTRSHEYVFLLAKSARYFWDAEGIAEAATATENRGGAHKVQALVPAPGARNDGFGDRWQPNGKRNARSVWLINTAACADAHFAVMPEKLAERCIRASTRPGDTVLDPYFGSGTTGRAALKLSRRAIGIDLNPDYMTIQDKRTNGVQMELLT